jgi:hypothetical protein
LVKTREGPKVGYRENFMPVGALRGSTEDESTMTFESAARVILETVMRLPETEKLPLQLRK